MSTHLTEYADYVCPFCYLAHGRLDEYRREHDEELVVDWHPYDIRSGKRSPDGALAPDADLNYPERVERRIEELRTEYGEDEMLDLDAVPKVDSVAAHVAAEYVRTEYPGRFRAFDGRVFDALWKEGRDVSDPTELVTIAESLDVNGDDIRTAVTDDDHRERIFERFAEARRDGITDAPTFVHDGRTATGVLSPAELREFLSDA